MRALKWIFASLVYLSSSTALAINTQPVGPGVNYTCQTSAPPPTGKPRNWTRCSDGHEIFTDLNDVDYDLTAAAGIMSGGVAYAPFQVFNSNGASGVRFSYYYGVGTNLPTGFSYDMLIAPTAFTDSYVLSDGEGSGHRILLGWSAGQKATGSVWNTTGASNTTIGGFETFNLNEWGNFAVAWDGSAMACLYLDGIPIGATAFGGPTQSPATNDGQLFLAGRTHQNASFKIAWLRAFEAYSPWAYKTGYCQAYRPERGSPSKIASKDGGNTTSTAGLLVDLEHPEAVVPDLSPVPFNGVSHPGQVWSSVIDASYTARYGALAAYAGFDNGPNMFSSQWIYDYTAPLGLVVSAPAYSGPASTCGAAGAKVCDDFARADNNYLWNTIPSLGTTETGSLGTKTWITHFLGDGNQYNSNNWSDWGVLHGRAINEDTCGISSLTGCASLAYVSNDTAGMTVQVDREPNGTFNPWGNTGVVFRVADDGNSGYAIYYADSNTKLNCFKWTGQAVFAACEGSPAAVAPNPATFTTLRVEAPDPVTGTVTVKTDGTSVWVIPGLTAFASQKNGGMIKTGYDNMHRWDKFRIF